MLCDNISRGSSCFSLSQGLFYFALRCIHLCVYGAVASLSAKAHCTRCKIVHVNEIWAFTVDFSSRLNCLNCWIFVLGIVPWPTQFSAIFKCFSDSGGGGGGDGGGVDGVGRYIYFWPQYNYISRIAIYQLNSNINGLILDRATNWNYLSTYANPMHFNKMTWSEIRQPV